MTTGAEPLVIGDNTDPDENDDGVDATTRRIGWQELLDRADPLSIACVRETAKWDGGRDFPFAHQANIELDTPPAREWAQRLRPTTRTAGFVFLDENGGQPHIDPLTGAPAVRTAGEVRTLLPQRLPATSPLAEVILRDPIWVRTTDGTLCPAPCDAYWGLNWGYGGLRTGQPRPGHRPAPHRHQHHPRRPRPRRRRRPRTTRYEDTQGAKCSLPADAR